MHVAYTKLPLLQTILVYPGDSPISRSVPFHIRIGTLSAERAEAIRPSKAAIVDMDANVRRWAELS